MLRKIIYLGFVCLLFVASIHSSDGQAVQKSGDLSGRVFYGGVPLYRAFVYVRDPVRKNDSVVALDSNGNFRLALRSGLYDVFVSEAGYVPVCKRIEITSGQTTNFPVELQPDREHLSDDRLPR